MADLFIVSTDQPRLLTALKKQGFLTSVMKLRAVARSAGDVVRRGRPRKTGARRGRPPVSKD